MLQGMLTTIKQQVNEIRAQGSSASARSVEKTILMLNSALEANSVNKKLALLCNLYEQMGGLAREATQLRKLLKRLKDLQLQVL